MKGTQSTPERLTQPRDVKQEAEFWLCHRDVSAVEIIRAIDSPSKLGTWQAVSKTCAIDNAEKRALDTQAKRL